MLEAAVPRKLFTVLSLTSNFAKTTQPLLTSTEHSPYINIEPLLKANVHQSISNIQGFKIDSLNVASLLKHIHERRILMNNKEIHVLAIDKTRLDNSIPIKLITVQGYS